MEKVQELVSQLWAQVLVLGIGRQKLSEPEGDFTFNLIESGEKDFFHGLLFRNKTSKGSIKVGYFLLVQFYGGDSQCDQLITGRLIHDLSIGSD